MSLSKILKKKKKKKSLRRRQCQTFATVTDDNLILAKAITVFPSYFICKKVDFELLHIHR